MVIKMSKNFSCGKRIKELRTKQGISQEQLALSADLTPAYIGLIERGCKNPTVLTIEKLCNALHISLYDFFAESVSDINDYNPYLSQIIHILSRKNESECKHYLKIIEMIESYIMCK